MRSRRHRYREARALKADPALFDERPLPIELMREEEMRRLDEACEREWREGDPS